MMAYQILQILTTYTVTIRLSACPLKCTILLSALFFIEVKIPIKKITLFMMKLHQTKLKLCSKHSKNNKRKEFLTKKKFKRICYVMVGGVSWKCTKRNARKKRTKFRSRSLQSQCMCACYVLYVCVQNCEQVILILVKENKLSYLTQLSISFSVFIHS